MTLDHPLLGKTGRTLLVMLAALAVPYASPRLRALRVVPAPWDPIAAAEDEGAAAPPAPVSPVAGEQALPASQNTPTVNNALPAEAVEATGSLPDIDPDLKATLRTVPIEDPTGHALDAFYARLRETDAHKPGAVTRILHYGDWKASKLAGPITSDGDYGLGGVSFASYGGGSALFGTATRGDFGRKVSRFDVYYLEQPGGGDVELDVKGLPADRFSTRGDAKVSRVHSLHVPDGEAKLALHAMGGGSVRLFGVALERDTPGIVYDALGSHAAMAVYWQRQDRQHWRDQLALRDPALIVFQYGTNESDLWKLDRAEYETALGGLVDELREAAPHASVLVVAPLDRAHDQGGKLVTKPVILDLVAIQRRVALSHGAAFWCTFDAMGGEGSMARWVRSKPQLGGGDLTHPTPLGAEVLGDMLADAIEAGYSASDAGR